MQATKLGMSEEPVSFSKWLIRSMEAPEHEKEDRKSVV